MTLFEKLTETDNLGFLLEWSRLFGTDILRHDDFDTARVLVDSHGPSQFVGFEGAGSESADAR